MGAGDWCQRGKKSAPNHRGQSAMNPSRVSTRACQYYSPKQQAKPSEKRMPQQTALASGDTRFAALSSRPDILPGPVPYSVSYSAQRQAVFSQSLGTLQLWPHTIDAQSLPVPFAHPDAFNLHQLPQAEMANFTAFKFKPGQSSADRVTINGKQFLSAPLATLRFARRIVGPIEQHPKPFKISGLPRLENIRLILSESDRNHEFACRRLVDIDKLMLAHYPATLRLLQQSSAAASKFLRQTDPESSSNLSIAIEHYRSYGDHVLMSAIACGYNTVFEFLDATMPGQYRTQEDVTLWCKQFLSRYSGDTYYEPDDVENRFSDPDQLQLETQILNKFLISGRPMSNVCLMKGVSEISCEESSRMSTRVVGRDYVRAFLSGQPIMYDGFLSTTFDPQVACDFAGGNPAMTPIYAIDFNDTSGRSEVLRRHALADLSSDVYPDQTASIMLAIRTRQARGKVLDDSDAPYIVDEKEVVLAPGHVLFPVMAVRCEKGYVLLADAYYRDLLPAFSTMAV